jgi:hypothetical protein
MGGVRDAGDCPTVSTGTVSTASVQAHWRVSEIAAPDNHFAAGPHRSVGVACRRGGDYVCGSPAISGRVVPTAGVRVVKRRIGTAPDSHFAASPDCRVSNSAEQRVGSGSRRPAIVGRIISAAAVQVSRLISSTPDDHFTAGPHSGVLPSSLGRVDCTSSCPAVGACVVPPAAVEPGTTVAPPQTTISLPVHTAL